MPTNASPEGHNVRVRPPFRHARTALIATLIAPALLLSGCGGDNGSDKPKAEPSVDLPKGDVKVPEGITLTKAGTALKFGEPALVAYEPNTKRSSVLSLSVDSVQQGRMVDFAAYQMDANTKKSRPYYVRVNVKNVGTGDLSRSAIPLFAVDNRNTLIQPSTFNNHFAKCPSLPLPSAFGANKAVRGCLVYLVPNRGTLVKMSFRPLQAFEPITWEGTIQPPPTTKKDSKKKKGKKKKGTS
jgi:hypothetical protein